MVATPAMEHFQIFLTPLPKDFSETISQVLLDEYLKGSTGTVL